MLSTNDYANIFHKRLKREEENESRNEIRGVIFTLAKEQFCQTYIRSPGDLKPPMLHFPKLEKDEKVFSVVKSLSDNETISVDCQILDGVALAGSTAWEARIQLFRNRKHIITTDNGIERKIRLKDKPLSLVINIGRFSFVSNGFILHSNQKQVHDPTNLNKNTNKSQQTSKNKSSSLSPKVVSTILSKLDSIECITKGVFLKPYSMKVYFSEELNPEINEINLTLLETLGIDCVDIDEKKDFIITKDSSNHGMYSHMGDKCISINEFLNFVRFRRL